MRGEPITTLLSELSNLLPSGRALTDPEILEAYARDRAAFTPYELPLALVRAREPQEVATVVRYCAKNRIPVVARGAGTGLSGGANAVRCSIVVCLEQMNQIIRID